MIWVKETRELGREIRVSPGLPNFNNALNKLSGLFKAYVINLVEFLELTSNKRFGATSES